MDLEARLKRQLDDRDPMLMHMPSHAAALITRFRIGLDGKTPQQRATGRQWRKPQVIYGEKIMIKEIKSGKKNDLQEKMTEGRYIGHHGRNTALLVLTKDGVKRGTGFRRLPESERWNPDGWSELSGMPWDIRRAAPSSAPAIGEGEPRHEPIALPQIAARTPAPRRVYVLKADIEKFGFTEGCKGCKSLKELGFVKPGSPHSEECRKRIAELVERDEERGAALTARALRAGKRASEEPSSEAGAVKRASMPSSEMDQTRGSGAVKRAREEQVEPGRPMPERMGGATEMADDLAARVRASKRSAEEADDSERVGRGDGPVDVQDLAEPMVQEAPLTGGSSGSAGAELGAAALELVEEEELTEEKAMIMTLVECQIRNHYAEHEMDISWTDLVDLASISVQLTAVDVAEIYSPARFTSRCAEFQLRPGFAPTWKP